MILKCLLKGSSEEKKSFQSHDKGIKINLLEKRSSEENLWSAFDVMEKIIGKILNSQSKKWRRNDRENKVLREIKKEFN